jgi:hypothetical protein
VRSQLARLHHDRGDYRQAVDAFRGSLEATGNSPFGLGLTPRESVDTAYLGWSLAELGEFPEATSRTEEALRRAEALENPLVAIQACMDVWMVHFRQGNIPAAIAPLERGLQVCYTFGLTALNFHGIAASPVIALAIRPISRRASPSSRPRRGRSRPSSSRSRAVA